jgi:hypothetical protein
MAKGMMLQNAADPRLDAAMFDVTTEAVCTELNSVKSLLPIADKTAGLLYKLLQLLPTLNLFQSFLDRKPSLAVAAYVKLLAGWTPEVNANGIMLQNAALPKLVADIVPVTTKLDWILVNPPTSSL